MPFPGALGRGGGASAYGLGPPTNTFADATARDAYATANASWLAEYNGNRFFWIRVGTDIQRRNAAGTAWENVTAVVQGPAGPLPTKATNTDVDTETDDTRYMTVLKTFRAIGRRVRNASTTVRGIVLLARNEDVDASESDTSRVVTVASAKRLIARLPTNVPRWVSGMGAVPGDLARDSDGTVYVNLVAVTAGSADSRVGPDGSHNWDTVTGFRGDWSNGNYYKRGNILAHSNVPYFVLADIGPSRTAPDSDSTHFLSLSGGSTLTDAQIGDRAFSNPPTDLTDDEKSAARTAIGAGTGDGGTGTSPTLANVTDALGLPAEAESNRGQIVTRNAGDENGYTTRALARADIPLTDVQIGDAAFSNPPSDLSDAEKAAARLAIGASGGTPSPSGDFYFGTSDDATPTAAELTVASSTGVGTVAAYNGEKHLLIARLASEADITSVLFSDDPSQTNQIGAFTKFGSTVTKDGSVYDVWVSNQLLAQSAALTITAS